MTAALESPRPCACCPCGGKRHSGEFWDRCFIEHRHGCDGCHGKREECNREADVPTTPSPVTAVDYVAQAANLLAEHQKCAWSGDRMACGMSIPEPSDAPFWVAHQAEVLAAAGLLATRTEWGVRHSPDDEPIHLTSEDAARQDVALSRAAYPWPEEVQLVSRPAHDWKDATDD